jgi:hypothetical protein
MNDSLTRRLIAEEHVLFGTSAKYTVVSLKQVIQLRESVPLEQDARLDIRSITS